MQKKLNIEHNNAINSSCIWNCLLYWQHVRMSYWLGKYLQCASDQSTSPTGPTMQSAGAVTGTSRANNRTFFFVFVFYFITKFTSEAHRETDTIYFLFFRVWGDPEASKAWPSRLQNRSTGLRTAYDCAVGGPECSSPKHKWCQGQSCRAPCCQI